MSKRRKAIERRPAPPPNERRDFRPAIGYAVIAAVAFIVRVIVAARIGALPIARSPQYDSLEYLAWAQHIAAGDFTWPAPPPHGPGYPFFLGGILAITGGSLVAARVVQSLLGALTCISTARVGARWFGERPGVVAGALLAIYAPLIRIDVSILAEGLLVCVTALALWSAASKRHPAITGALLGFAAIVRPTALLLLPLFVVIAAETWRRRAVFLVAMAVVIAPVTIANWRTMHAFIPIQAFGGMNTYLGNSPLRDGLASARPGGEWDVIASDAVRHGATTVTEEERYFAQKTRREIAAHPIAFVKLLAAKLVRTFQDDEIRDTDSFYFYAQFSPLLRWLPSFTLLFALFAAGAFAADWRRRETRDAALLLALTACTTVFLVVGARYRIPIAIPLALFGGVTVAHVRTLRDAKRIGALAVIAIVAGACTRVWPHPPSHNFAEEWALTSQGLTKEENAVEAESAARNAIEADAKNALGWDALGTALNLANKKSDARDALLRATALNPDFEAAHLHLGNVLADLRDTAGAAREYAAAAELSPHDPRPVAHLAPLLAQRGDLVGAQRLYARLVELSPGDSDAMLTLARLDGALGKPADGLAVAQRAATIRELEPPEWMMVALLAAQAGNPDVATTALQRAGGAAASPQGMFIAALIAHAAHRDDEALRTLDELLARVPDFAEAQRMRAAIAQKK